MTHPPTHDGERESKTSGAKKSKNRSRSSTSLIVDITETLGTNLGRNTTSAGEERRGNDREWQGDVWDERVKQKKKGG
jgi:hypothetical protein